MTDIILECTLYIFVDSDKFITAFLKVYFCAFEFIELAVRLVGVIRLDSLES